ncbi:hypothetical protein EON81_28490 [bacterium]|nr:MAG: hypothetical protein EON81_28490 [bacterium]
MLLMFDEEFEEISRNRAISLSGSATSKPKARRVSELLSEPRQRPTMWTTKDNVTIPIRSMEQSHLTNTIAWLRRGALQIEGALRATGNRIAENPADALDEIENITVLAAQHAEKLFNIETFLEEQKRRDTEASARGTGRARYEMLMGRTVPESPNRQATAAPAEDEYDPFAETDEQRAARLARESE